MDVGRILIGLGITPNTVGFFYLLRAIALFKENPSIKISDVCQTISRERQVTETSVEKSMRYALSLVNTNTDSFKKYVPLNRRDISLSEFISIIAYTTKEEH